jgi:nucleoside-diphosphate-sugar epimerase
MILSMAFDGDATYAFVDVHALAEGMCLAVEKAPIGEDYIFSGEPTTLGVLFEKSARYPGGMKVRLYLPRWFMRPQMMLLETLQRALGLPTFMSRATVEASRGHLNYSVAKARRDLGWRHPDSNAMWE